MANNKVQLSNGTVVIDLTSDTVTSASHIKNGLVGHLADGTTATGTLIEKDVKSVTYNLTGGATASVSTTEVVTGQGFSVKLKTPAGYSLNGVAITMGGVDITNQVFEGESGGSEPELDTKTITVNGVYTASDDNLDGYSDVVVSVQNSYTISDEGKVVSNGALVTQGSDTVMQNGTIDTTLIGSLLVNVPSTGANNIVQGTFTTGSTRAGTGTTSINYTGSGYPIALLVYVTGGVYNNTSSGNANWYNSVNRYDVGYYSMVKSIVTTTPTYASSGDDNQGAVTIIYKNSTSVSTTYNRNSSMTANTYTSSSTNPSNSTGCVRFKGNGKNLAWYVGNLTNTTLGLAPATSYSYIVIYSE